MSQASFKALQDRPASEWSSASRVQSWLWSTSDPDEGFKGRQSLSSGRPDTPVQSASRGITKIPSIALFSFFPRSTAVFPTILSLGVPLPLVTIPNTVIKQMDVGSGSSARDDTQLHENDPFAQSKQAETGVLSDSAFIAQWAAQLGHGTSDSHMPREGPGLVKEPLHQQHQQDVGSRTPDIPGPPAPTISSGRSRASSIKSIWSEPTHDGASTAPSSVSTASVLSDYDGIIDIYLEDRSIRADDSSIVGYGNPLYEWAE